MASAAACTTSGRSPPTSSPSSRRTTPPPATTTSSRDDSVWRRGGLAAAPPPRLPHARGAPRCLCPTWGRSPGRRRRGRSSSWRRAMPERSGERSVIEVSSFHQGPHLAVRHREEHHPEATVRVHPPDALRPEDLDRLPDAPGDLARRFRLVVLDVDHADAQGDRRLQVPKHLELVVAAPGELQDEVVARQRVEERQQLPEETLLDGLARPQPPCHDGAP